MSVIVVDYGMGNIGSIVNMVRKAGGQAVSASTPGEIEKAEKLILPGVGAFDNGIQNLRAMGLVDVLRRKVIEEETPILGICLGMQLFTKSSEEGSLPGLGWINAKTVRFRFEGENASLRVPHMGWNRIEIARPSPLYRDMFEDPGFYFVHSYHVVCEDRADVLSTTRYGIDFVSSLQKGRLFATQFHPEKSHKFGLKVIENFVGL
ncbi:MAG: imidazole glycerol phosphate synthase subunit HisH [Elusimicrobia bacterium]|nr:imidazole glycerol phosphate synthase subunit HisH [Elusimicrobiota bacterium]